MTHAQTREQALRELSAAVARMDPDAKLSPAQVKYQIDAILALPADAAGLPWVSVEERLPERGTEIMTLMADGEMAFGPVELATHWLPLSAIPLPDREGE